MKILKHDILPWIGVIGVCVLPVLSNAGYAVNSLEYVAALAAVIIIAIFFWSLSAIVPVGAISLSGLLLFSTSLYFGKFFVGNMVFTVAALLFATIFVWLAMRNFKHALLVAGVVSFSQIISAALWTPSPIHKLYEKALARPDLPPIVHLMMDEHAGLAAFPTEAVPPKDMMELQNAYIAKGFMVFTHAYSADKDTDYALARLMNPELSEPKKVLHGQNPVRITQSSIFDIIGLSRALDISSIPEIDPSEALGANPALARHMAYNINNMRDIAGEFALTLPERGMIALYLSVEWLEYGIKSPVARWILQMPAGRALDSRIKIRGNVYPIVARSVMHQFIERLTCCGARGTYYFAHFIFPHRPFLFDRHCRLLPIKQWNNGWKKGAMQDKKNWIRLYRMHFDQASCAASDIFKLTDSVSKNPNFADAVIIVHSDHGSRIILSPGREPQRDLRGSFFALKIPGQVAEVIDKPVRLDMLYANLLENDFKTINIEKLWPLSDSPY